MVIFDHQPKLFVILSLSWSYCMHFLWRLYEKYITATSSQPILFRAVSNLFVSCFDFFRIILAQIVSGYFTNLFNYPKLVEKNYKSCIYVWERLIFKSFLWLNLMKRIKNLCWYLFTSLHVQSGQRSLEAAILIVAISLSFFMLATALSNITQMHAFSSFFAVHQTSQDCCCEFSHICTNAYTKRLSPTYKVIQNVFLWY